MSTKKLTIKEQIAMWQNMKVNKEMEALEEKINTVKKVDIKTFDSQPKTTKPIQKTTTTKTNNKSLSNNETLSFIDFDGVKHQYVSSIFGYSTAMTTNKPSVLIDRVPDLKKMIKGGKSFTSWQPTHSLLTKEYIEVGFSEPGYITGVEIFENWNPGAIIKISAHPYDSKMGNTRYGKKNWKPIWTASNPESLEGTRKFNPKLETKERIYTSLLRIDISLKREVPYYQIAGVCLLTSESALKHQLNISPQVSTCFNDFKLIIKNGDKKKEFPTSKLLLSTLSQYFYDLLMKNASLHEIEFEFDLKYFETVYSYLQKMTISFDEEDIIDLYLIIDKLSFDHLKIQLFEQFPKSICISNYHHLWNKIQENNSNPNIKQFQSLLNDFIYRSFSDIIHDDNFVQVSDDFINYYTSKNELIVNEFELCLALFNRDKSINLKDHIRFGLIQGDNWETVQGLTKLKVKPNNITLQRNKNH
eukprot:gene2991-5001_t